MFLFCYQWVLPPLPIRGEHLDTAKYAIPDFIQYIVLSLSLFLPPSSPISQFTEYLSEYPFWWLSEIARMPLLFGKCKSWGSLSISAHLQGNTMLERWHWPWLPCSPACRSAINVYWLLNYFHSQSH